MKVKIVKCSGDYWYKDKIGEVVEVLNGSDKYCLEDKELIDKRYYLLIDKVDTIPVSEIRYEDKVELC